MYRSVSLALAGHQVPAAEGTAGAAKLLGGVCPVVSPHQGLHHVSQSHGGVQEDTSPWTDGRKLYIFKEPSTNFYNRYLQKLKTFDIRVLCSTCIYLSCRCFVALCYWTSPPSPQKPDYEFNEMVLYESQLLLESGRPDEALKHLQAFEQHICDFLTYWETKGKRGRERDRRE